MSGTDSQLLETVINTHRRCASDGNWFDIDRVLNTLNEHTEIHERNSPQSLSEGCSMSLNGSQTTDMQCEAESAEVLLKNITNLRNCGEEKLKEMLLQTQEQLNLKNGEIQKMTQLRDTITAELAELTSCLFEEANRMVNEANREKFMAEKRAKECQLAVSLLQEELKVFKSFSTRFKISQKLNRNQSFDGSKLSKSHHLKSAEETKLLSLGVASSNANENSDKYADFEKLDTKLFHDFLVWQENPVLQCDSTFYDQIIANDVKPCLSFCQNDIRDQILASCEANRLVIESITQSQNGQEESKPKTMHCQLSGTARVCNFKVVILDTESNPQSCYVVCKMARNRIAAVCELLTFLRHIAQNLYNSSQSIDLFLKLNDLQKLCAMTRLGFI
ncbi:guanine nucleotide exchange factor for Rab-3A-like isoform X2 [Convolutriloba macropyga]|uniref:guanine nucleotide exchange factor for Rab-3A-like isoform X2 n=1 Tax=Convolutriloba macropyga TaxID=536237 RepID=UPI003F51F2C8